MTRGRLALGVVAAAAFGAAAAPAGAALPGANGQIAFERAGSLWVAGADGSGAKKIVQGGGFPSFSPDGRRIAFQRRVRGDTEIWIANANGSRAKQLTKAVGSSIRPSFSGDGRRILFESSRRGENAPYVMNVTGSGQTPLPLTGFQAAAQFSATGPIAFGCLAASGNTGICAANADGSGAREVTDDTSAGFHVNPSWSPDGGRIVFSAQPGGPLDVFVVNADGTGRTRLTTAPAGSSQDSDEAAFSPDGQKIVFESNRTGSRNDVWVMNADGSGQTLLIANGSAPDWGPAPR